MFISVIGSGYVGTTVAACLAEAGHEVVNIDVDESVVESINTGKSPIHEPGLDDLVADHGGKRLHATTDYGMAQETDISLLALPTPSTTGGHVDTSYVKAGAESLAEALDGKTDRHVVAVKSTVIPGTTDSVVEPAFEAVDGEVAVVSNPEFLREGSAVADFRDPDKVVVGAAEDWAVERLREMYTPLLTDDDRFFATDRREAEMVKYANNAFLAAKVSLINDIGNICKEFDVDTYEIADALSMDNRISGKFLRSGLGWGDRVFQRT